MLKIIFNIIFKSFIISLSGCYIGAFAFASPFKTAVVINSTDKLVEEIRISHGAKPALVQALGYCEPHSEIIKLRPTDWSGLFSKEKFGFAHDRRGRKSHSIVSDEVIDGVLNIEWPGVSASLFDVKIKDANLSDAQRYSPGELIDYLLSTKETRALMHHLKMRPMIQFTGVTPQPSLGQPHIDGLIRDKSIKNILNMILFRFKGIIVYKECVLSSGQRRVSFDYYAPVDMRN